MDEDILCRKEMVPLRKHVESLLEELDIRLSERFAFQEKSVNQALQSAEKVILKAEASADKRFEAVNEFRAMVNDLIRTMMPRAESDNRYNALMSRVEALTLSMMPRAESDHRYSALNERVNTVVMDLEKREATGQGMQKSWGFLTGALGIVAAVVATFFMVLEHLMMTPPPLK